MKKQTFLIPLIVLLVIISASAALFILKPDAVKKFLGMEEKAQPVQTVQTEEEAQPEETAGDTVAPVVEISPESQQMIGVKTEDVAVRPLIKVIRAVGRIEYSEQRLATVNAKVEGWIEKLHVDFTGRYVKKGEPLARIYSPELIATQKELLMALQWGKGTEKGAAITDDTGALIEASRQRLRLWDISEAEIKKIESAGKPLRTLTIHSPVSGYVIEKMVTEGMKVMPGEKLLTIADLSTVWVISDIYEYETPYIKVGQTAKITPSYIPGREFTARLDYIYPALSPETRTVKARFELPNPKLELKPQMFADVEIKVDLGKRLSIPEEAIIDTGQRQIVYVDKGDGYFEPREVALGIRAEGMREVLKGLKIGEKVASSATFLIDSEAQLKGIKPLSGNTPEIGGGTGKHSHGR